MKRIQKDLSIDLPVKISLQWFRSSRASWKLPLENE